MAGYFVQLGEGIDCYFAGQGSASTNVDAGPVYQDTKVGFLARRERPQSSGEDDGFTHD